MWLYLTPQHDGFLCTATWGLKGHAHSTELSCLALHQGSSNLSPEGQSAAEFSSSPDQTHCDCLMILKTLINMLRCVWLGLELNSAGVGQICPTCTAISLDSLNLLTLLCMVLGERLKYFALWNVIFYLFDTSLVKFGTKWWAMIQFCLQRLKCIPKHDTLTYYQLTCLL